MRIGILWHVVYPWDIRMEKIIKVLTDNGHEVHLVCKGKDGLAPFEDNGALKIYRIHAGAVLGSRALGRVLGAPLPINPYWYTKALRVFREARVDRLVVRDLPLGLLAGMLGRRLGVPVFFDMAENFPAALVAYNNAFYKPFLFGNGWLPKQYEKISLRYMTQVFVVADEQIERLTRIGVDRARISVVMNTPDVEYYLDRAQESGARGDSADATLLYIGKVDAHRGIAVLVRAMPHIIKRYPAVKLSIVGDGTEKRALERLAAELGVADRIVFHGWARFDRVPGFIADSTICLIPHLKSEHTETTVPNKIFDYMVFGKPVVASDCAPLARIIRDARCGQVFRSGDTKDLADKVVSLLTAPDREAIGANGRVAVMARYHWRRDAALLLERLSSDAVAEQTPLQSGTPL
jgi:glycosyltransferase involved in cell wall biosynthesis